MNCKDIQIPKWEESLKNLLNRLPLEERYLCVASIPGPVLELRSGTLPISFVNCKGSKKFIPYIANLTGLEISKINEYARMIAREYSLSKIIKKYNKMTIDILSSNILLVDYIKAYIHRLHGTSIYSNTFTKIREIRLRIYNQITTVSYPADLVSIGLLWEVFAEEVYYFQEPVEHIYDFGANIGLSTIYFHLLNPHAEIVCVEPMYENINLLKRNITNNNIPSRIICAAVGNTEEEVTLFFGDQSHALPSLCTKQSKTRKIKMIPFNKIVCGDRYGLKIDIEGAEELLVEFPSIIKKAAWIVGELHYSSDTERNLHIDAFFDIVQANFKVKKSRPIIYFVGDDVLLCVSFKTIERL